MRRRGGTSAAQRDSDLENKGAKEAQQRTFKAVQKLQPLSPHSGKNFELVKDRNSAIEVLAHRGATQDVFGSVNLQSLEGQSLIQKEKRIEISDDESSNNSEEDETFDLCHFPLICFGSNNRQQLGLKASVLNVTEPTGIPNLEPQFRVGTVGSSNTTTLITHQASGEMYQCSENTGGTFKKIDTNGTFVLDVGTNGTTHFFLSGKRQLYSWGDNRFGTLGRKSLQEGNAKEDKKGQRKKIVENRERDRLRQDVLKVEYGLVDSLSKFRVSQICIGTSHAVALLTAGSVYTWGRNNLGQLGLGDFKDRDRPSPVDFLNGCKVVCIAAAANQSAACGDTLIGIHFAKRVNLKTARRTTFTWGCRDDNRLGHGRFDGDKIFMDFDLDPRKKVHPGDYMPNFDEKRTCCRPCYLPELFNTDKPIFKLALGDRHGLALTEAGVPYSWGDNSYGQLGLGHQYNESTPKLIKAVSNILHISAGSLHSAFLTASGLLYMSGFNHYGELGLGDCAMRNSPMPHVALATQGIRPNGVICSSGSTLVWTKVSSKDAQMCFQDNFRQRQCRIFNKDSADGSTMTVRREAESDGYAYMALAGPGTIKGKYEWRVQVDRIMSDDSPIGIGVAPESDMDPYMFDLFEQGPAWLFLSSGEKHYMGDTESYSDKYFEKDVIGVHLDLDLGVLRFSRRGRDAGLCYYLATANPLFLCVSLASEGDQVTLLEPEEEDMSALTDSGTEVCFNYEGINETSGIEVFYNCGPCKLFICRACARKCKHRLHFCQLAVNHKASSQPCQCNPITCQSRNDDV